MGILRHASDRLNNWFSNHVGTIMIVLAIITIIQLLIIIDLSEKSTRRYSKLYKNLWRAECTIDDVEGKVNGIEGAIDDVDEKVKGIESTIDDVEGKTKGIESAIDDVEGKVNGIKSNIDIVLRNQENIKRQIEDLSYEVKKLKVNQTNPQPTNTLRSWY